MAEIATAETVSDDDEVNLDHLIADLDARIHGQQPMNDAKGEYNQICKDQNEARGYNKAAMNMLTKLRKMKEEKFNDVVRTLAPGLNLLVETRAQAGTDDMFDDGADVVQISG